MIPCCLWRKIVKARYCVGASVVIPFTKGPVDYVPEEFLLSEHIHTIKNPYKITAENKGIQISSRESGELCAFGDHEMIGSVPGNLINNAVK